MPDPDWPCLPPEANYLRLAGDGVAGTATTLASAAAWQALAAGNEVAVALSMLNTAVTSLNFEGIGGARSADAIAGVNTALEMLSAWAQEKPPIMVSAVTAYQAAVSAMIPAEVSLANRAAQAADVAMNPLVLGALTPAIVALDAEYFGEHWPHNASAGAAYGAALTGLLAALTIPPPLSPPGASPAAAVGAAGAVSGTGGAAVAEEFLSQPVQAAMGAMAPLAGMFQAPMQAIGGLVGMLPNAWRGSPFDDTDSSADLLDATDVGFDDDGSDDLVPNSFGIGGGVAGVGAGTGGAVVGGPAMGSPALGPLPGLTSYVRPPGGFEAVESGRPVGLRGGLLSAATEHRVPPVGGIPLAPQLGADTRASTQKKDVAQARIVLGDPAHPHR